MQFTIGFKHGGKACHVTVEGEDALSAALALKAERPEATIMYVRQKSTRRCAPPSLGRRQRRPLKRRKASSAPTVSFAPIEARGPARLILRLRRRAEFAASRRRVNVAETPKDRCSPRLAPITFIPG